MSAGWTLNHLPAMSRGKYDSGARQSRWTTLHRDGVFADFWWFQGRWKHPTDELSKFRLCFFFLWQPWLTDVSAKISISAAPSKRGAKGKLETLQIEGPLSHYRSWARSRCLVGGMMPLGRIITLGWQSPFSWLHWAGCSHGTQHMLGDVCKSATELIWRWKIGTIHGSVPVSWFLPKAGTSKNGSTHQHVM